MIEIDIRSAMLADTGLSAIVSDRIAAMIMNAGELRPYITYQLISDNRYPTLNGSSNNRSGRFQINCFSTNYGQAKQISELVQEIIESSSSFDSIFNGCQDLYDSTTKLYYVVVDYSLHKQD